jgi:hypothetical protein
VSEGRDVATTAVNFFSFFTVLSNVSSVVVLAVAGIRAFVKAHVPEPYPFLDPHVVGGYGGVAVYVVGIAVALAAVAALVVAVGRRRAVVEPAPAQVLA